MRGRLGVFTLTAFVGCRSAASPEPPPPSAPLDVRAPAPAPPPPVTTANSHAAPIAEGGRRTAPHPAIATGCRKDIGALCDGPCPRYEAALAETERARTDYRPENCTGLGSGDVAVGSCETFRFVEDGDCLSGLTRWFDASGALIGAYAWGDVKRSCGSATVYGTVPSCQRGSR